MIFLTILVTAVNLIYNDTLNSEDWFGGDMEGRAHSLIFINITTRLYAFSK